MPITRTATYTATYTRLVLIELQISRILGRVRAAKSTQDSILKGVRNKWIGEIFLYGMNASGLCSAELYVRIDWERNKMHMAAGKDSIFLDPSWQGGVSLEVERTLALFLEFISSERLNVSIQTRYAPRVDRAYANRVLGYKNANPVKWVGGAVGTAMTIPELDEFTIGLNLAQQVPP
jgi:hypothetical protein